MSIRWSFSIVSRLSLGSERSLCSRLCTAWRPRSPSLVGAARGPHRGSRRRRRWCALEAGMHAQRWSMHATTACAWRARLVAGRTTRVRTARVPNRVRRAVYEWSPARDDRDASSVTTSRGDRRTHLDSPLGTSVRMVEKHYGTLIDGARGDRVSPRRSRRGAPQGDRAPATRRRESDHREGVVRVTPDPPRPGLRARDGSGASGALAAQSSTIAMARAASQMLPRPWGKPVLTVSTGWSGSTQAAAGRFEFRCSVSRPGGSRGRRQRVAPSPRS